jgi:H/ACA ribonucleoprotein complex subunit 1
VKLSEGLKASSFKTDQKIYIDPYKLLPLERFLGDGQKQQRGGGGGQRGRGQRGGGGRGGGLHLY